VVALFWAGLAVVGMYRLRRRNSVGRLHRFGTDSVPMRRQGHQAPLRWLASPTMAAHLHRRLRRAVTAMRIAVPAPRRRSPRGTFHEVADDLEHQAVTTDVELVAAQRLPVAHRRAAQRLLATRVAEIERLAAQVVVTAGIGSGGLDHGSGLAGLDGLAVRVDALRQAHDELASIERVAGLRAG
jgi:hypothetical protein